jgi:hypothetical protein
MEKMDAMVDLVRALAKKCEEFERYKENSDTYYRWYKEGQEENRKLREKLDAAGIDY